MRVRILPPMPITRRGGRSSTARALGCGTSDVGSIPIDHTNSNYMEGWRSPVDRSRLENGQGAKPSWVRIPGPPPSTFGRIKEVLQCPNSTAPIPFDVMSKRRRGFPSETNVKRGRRIIHGDKELEEKLGRRDLCPCGSARRFQHMLHAERAVSTAPAGSITFATEQPSSSPRNSTSQRPVS